MDDLYNIAIEAAIEAGREIMKVYNSDDFQISEKSDHSPLTKADSVAHEHIVSFLKNSSLPVLSEEGRDIPYAERSKWTSFWLVDPLDGTKEFIKRNGEFTVNIALIEHGKPVFGVVYAPVPEDLYVGVVGKGAWKVHSPGLKSADQLEEIGVHIPIVTQDNNPEQENTIYRVVASRSHLNIDTENYLEKLKAEKGAIEIVTIGSSLKLCLVASGEADEYPRLGPTMEWDIAAAHAVVKSAGGSVTVFGTDKEMRYNKKELLNPYFVTRMDTNDTNGHEYSC